VSEPSRPVDVDAVLTTIEAPWVAHTVAVFNDRDVELAPGQVFVVPRGVQHQPIAAPGTETLMVEPSATINTGDTPSLFTTQRRLVGE
jgi:hypothetical protein